MDLKCFKRRFRSVLTLTISHFQSSTMHVHVGIIILAPIFMCLWIYFLVLIVDILVPKPNTDIRSTERNYIVRNITPNIFPVKNKTKSDVNNKKKNFHVPKFMLELYENNRIEGKKFKPPDVVRSLIPTHAGNNLTQRRQKFNTNKNFTIENVVLSFLGPIENNEIFELPSENHILVFDLPSSNKDETFLSAELKIHSLVMFDERRNIGEEQNNQLLHLPLVSVSQQLVPDSKPQNL